MASSKLEVFDNKKEIFRGLTAFQLVKNADLATFRQAIENNKLNPKGNFNSFVKPLALGGVIAPLIHVAAGHGQIEKVQYLLDLQVHIDSLDSLDETALISAAACRQQDLVKLLLDKGADYIYALQWCLFTYSKSDYWKERNLIIISSLITQDFLIERRHATAITISEELNDPNLDQEIKKSLSLFVNAIEQEFEKLIDRLANDPKSVFTTDSKTIRAFSPSLSSSLYYRYKEPFDLKASRAQLEVASKSDPFGIAHLFLGDYYAEGIGGSQNPEKAICHYVMACQKRPFAEELLARLQKLAEACSDNTRCLLAIADLYYHHLDQPFKALMILDQCIFQVFPQKDLVVQAAKLYLAIGDDYLRRKELGKMDECYEKACKLEVGPAFLKLANAHLCHPRNGEKADYLSAISCYQQAEIAKFEPVSGAHEALIEILREEAAAPEIKQKAEQALLSILKKHPERVNIHLHLALYYQQTKQIELKLLHSSVVIFQKDKQFTIKYSIVGDGDYNDDCRNRISTYLAIATGNHQGFQGDRQLDKYIQEICDSPYIPPKMKEAAELLRQKLQEELLIKEGIGPQDGGVGEEKDNLLFEL